MPRLTRGNIESVNDLPTAEVEVPEWNGHVVVQTMTGGDRDAFQHEVLKRSTEDGKMDIRGIKAMLVQHTVIDDDGELMWEPEDLDIIQGKSPVAIDRIYDEAAKLNGLTAEEVEEVVADFAPTTSVYSGTT